MAQKKLIHSEAMRLIRRITEPAFLEEIRVPRRRMDAMLRRVDWEKVLQMPEVTEGRISTERVCQICRPVLDCLGQPPSGGYMEAAYHYIRFRMFHQQEYLAELKRYETGILIFLRILQFFLDKERYREPFDPLTDLYFMTDEEAANWPNGEAYMRFRRTWRGQFVYEMLRLGEEVTPYHSLPHIAGVHFVATTIAKELSEKGVPVDRALAGAAAAGHDIGKFGCRPDERVPYMHYYYTDLWFHENGMDEIGYISANHSTWDLEIENLTAESLCLIYADFRVKQKKVDGKLVTHIYSLAESFDVILSKLDNVDEEKLRRYRFVYSRLKDFEDYAVSLGVDVTLSGRKNLPAQDVDVSLLPYTQVLRRLTGMGVDHNIRVMNTLSTERQFGYLLEAARSEKNWRHIRAYLTVFQEYSTYLSFEQKKQTLGFFYDLLFHKEGDIRRYAAELIGQLIAEYDAGYRKEMPAQMVGWEEADAISVLEETLDRIIAPDHKLTARHKFRMSCTLKIIVESLLERAAGEDGPKFGAVLLNRYRNRVEDENGAFALLDTLDTVPKRMSRLSDEEILVCTEFARQYVDSDIDKLRLAAARFFKNISGLLPAGHPALSGLEDIARNLTAQTDDITMVFLQYSILKNLGADTAEQENRLYHMDFASEIYLANLKVSTPWILKSINIELLADQAWHGRVEHMLHIATHLANLIKISDYVDVRISAGEILLKLAGMLQPDQRNEIAVELAKGLEVGEYEYSKYIPGCLGRFALWLPGEQLDELLMNLRASLASPNERIAGVALETAGVMLTWFEEYSERFPEEKDALVLQEKVLGLLLSGMANYRGQVRQEAIQVLGRFFESETASAAIKAWAVGLVYRKILFLLGEYEGGQLDMYYRSALLSHLCRFLSIYRIDYGELTTPEYEKIAFFPGTFDPFTLSHKGIVQCIRDLGYEVYLSVDEFSWSKNMQPSLMRRQIVSMSVADDIHVHLFPNSIPINIANPADLQKLTSLFPGKKVYLVAGSDVIQGASAYRKPPGPDSIHQMNHILFGRWPAELSAEQIREKEQKISNLIRGEVIWLNLPYHLEDISSTRIRENIDLNRDISHLIDPVVQEYIYTKNLYLNESQDKWILSRHTIDRILYEELADYAADELCRTVLAKDPEAELIIGNIREKREMVLLMRDYPTDQTVGILRMKVATSSQLMENFSDVELADRIRGRCGYGSVLLIGGIYISPECPYVAPEQWLLTQCLTEAISRGCSVAVFVPDTRQADYIYDVIRRQGFMPADVRNTGIMMTDMHKPFILLHNMMTTFKEPFASDRILIDAIEKAHQKLQDMLVQLYPGNLVLSISSDYLMEEMVGRVTQINDVPRYPAKDRENTLGPLMCVPFGKLLRGRVVPNTVTKTLHTDKVYNEDLAHGVIEPFHGYASLESQIRVIKSFNRPIVLVDDILHHKGRLMTILPMLKKEGVEVRQLLVGILTEHGHDRMAASGIPIDCIHSLPSLHWWMSESTLYPFIGGDAVRREEWQTEGLTPSVNFIMPYAVPRFPDCPAEIYYRFSECCLENARDIFLLLEAEYRRQYGRNLTLNRLNEAVILPLCPDRGSCLSYDTNLSPSVFLENDLHMLHREGWLFFRRGKT